MINMDGINLIQTGYKSLTINGAHIAATTDEGKRVYVRGHGLPDDNWYNERHAAVMDAVTQLERAVRALLDEGGVQ
jgi:hypothetical protein